MMVVQDANLSTSLQCLEDPDDAAPSFTIEPPNPSFANERGSITLRWTYNINGLFRDAELKLLPSTTIAVKDGIGLSVSSVYFNRALVTISHSETLLTLQRVNGSDEGDYQFQIRNANLEVVVSVVKISVQSSASLTNVSSDKTLLEGSDLKLFCDATGRPTPNVTWVKIFPGGSESDVLHRRSWDFINISRSDAGTYRCTANNGVGNPVHHTVKVTVAFSPQVNLQNNGYVAREKSVSLHCQVDGYPTPTITWTPCKPQENMCDKSRLNISKVLRDDVFTCTAVNNLGFDSASTTLEIGDDVVNLTLIITREECSVNDKSFLNRLQEPISWIFENESAYRRTTVMNVRCGGFIVDVNLKFSSGVAEQWVLAALKRAAKNGKLGEFNVDASSIHGTQAIFLRTTTPGFPEVKVLQGCSCNCSVLIVLVSILAGIILILTAYIIWSHKKGTAKGVDGRLYAATNEKREEKDLNAAVEMENRQLNETSSEQQTFEVSSRCQYMPLAKARQISRYPEDQSTSDTSSFSQYASLHPSTLSYEILRENVIIENIIGKGSFGLVAKGKVKNLHRRPEATQVAIKMLKADAPETDRKDLLSELEVMKTLNPHPNVIKLLGCVTESEPLLVLIEYVPYGDLLGYLRKSRGLNDTYYKAPDIKPQTSLTSQKLIKFAWQIADGMNYLSSRSIIHRDLAARNVLVGEKETCKVTDFGMARDVQQENIYERKTKGRLPVKWTAYEALLYGIYTTKSDIWSYGVLLYEIFTIGGSPYPQIDGRRIANILQKGYRMPKPQHVDDELYKIMTMCWQENPDARPSFSELRDRLKTMGNQHKRLINMKMYNKQLYENVEDLVV